MTKQMSAEEKLDIRESEIEKLEKKLGPELVAELRALDLCDLDRRLLTLAKYREEIVTGKAQDKELNELREKVKLLNKPYNDSLRDNKNRARLVGLIIEEKKDDENFM